MQSGNEATAGQDAAKRHMSNAPHPITRGIPSPLTSLSSSSPPPSPSPSHPHRKCPQLGECLCERRVRGGGEELQRNNGSWRLAGRRRLPVQAVVTPTEASSPNPALFTATTVMEYWVSGFRLVHLAWNSVTLCGLVPGQLTCNKKNQDTIDYVGE